LSALSKLVSYIYLPITALDWAKMDRSINPLRPWRIYATCPISMPSDPQQNGGRLQDWIGVRPYSHDHLCSRSTVPALLGSSVKKASQGGYIAVNTPGTPALILLATGSEVGFCVKAAKACEGSRSLAKAGHCSSCRQQHALPRSIFASIPRLPSQCLAMKHSYLES
jgi:hypothetical protein